ncbi:MAG: ABC transporter ATP-binding protein, partial [Betaproteobacteria bacterium]
LQDYGGALCVVAHDRHLLRATTDELWLVDDGMLAPFDGDLDDYRDYVLSRKRRPRDEARDGGVDAARPVDRRAQKRAQAQARQKDFDARKPFHSRQAALEAAMAALTAEKTALEAWLASAEAYVEESRESLKAALARQGEIAWTLARREAEWLEVEEALGRQGGSAAG